jgi:hypothetical protein
MQIRETVRSGRRENFYVTDNGFIDHYAKEMQPTDVAVYHALERYANCHTRSTWVGTAKIAEVLNISQRTVQRSLKVLDDLKLIRIVQTATVKMYFIVPVPPRARTAASPLFDGIEEEQLFPNGDIGVACTTDESPLPPLVSRMPSRASRTATAVSRTSDVYDTAYKEEQNLLNKTEEQDLFTKTQDRKDNELVESAQSVVRILKLPDTSLSAAIAAVEERRRRTHLSMAGIVQDIVTAANHAERRGIDKQDFLVGFLAEKLARRMLKSLALPDTNNLVSTVAASVKAEVAYTGLTADEVADLITGAAVEDRNKGTAIDRFYFEGVKWRPNARVSKAEQRKLNNLEVNARVKQRLRERLGAS